MPVGTSAAIGIAVLFVCATKCPLATILLCCEMFGFSSILLITPIVIICYALAGYQGLYNNQKDIFTLIKSKKRLE
jgi:H+/Cl- antiporter ClcA